MCKGGGTESMARTMSAITRVVWVPSVGGILEWPPGVSTSIRNAAFPCTPRAACWQVRTFPAAALPTHITDYAGWSLEDPEIKVYGCIC